MSEASKARRRRRNKTRDGASEQAISDVCAYIRAGALLTDSADVAAREDIAESIERHFAPAQAPE